MSREELERVRADVERLDSLAIKIQMCQTWADTGLRDLEAGKSEISAATRAATHIAQAVRACKEFSSYFEKKIGAISPSEGERGQE